MRRSLSFWSCLLLACGAPAEPATPAEVLDRTEAPRPSTALAELELDAEGTLTELGSVVDDGSMGALLPARIVDLVEAGVELPSAIRSAIVPAGGARAIGFIGDSDIEVVWAFRIGTLAEGAVATEPGAPRGARWVTGEPIAIAGDVVVAGRTRARVEESLPYLAFTAMPRVAEAGRLVVTSTREFTGTYLRAILDGRLTGAMLDLRRSAEAASRAHAEPPVLGAPERFVDRLRARLAEWVALVPDLGEARFTLARVENGLRLEIDAAVASGSPLADVLASMPPGDLVGLGSLPETTAIALATRSSPEARVPRTERLLADLAEIAGDRLAEAERTALASTSAAWDAALGETLIVGVGRSEAGLFTLAVSPDAAPTEDELFAPFWSPRSRPYETAIVALLAGCDPTEPPRRGPPVLCGDARFETAHAPTGGLAAAIERSDAGALAASTLEATAHARPVFSASPDVTRALRPHEGPAHFALALVPSRLLPLLSAIEGGGAVSSAPPATLAISLHPGAGGHVVLLVTADATSIRDTIAAGRMFAAP